ncbi:[NiFe]-hydrogenase assembly chaperone HybE [Profundibacter sp.]|uniref:[NiFe]-hydrogenase assembly chaperone HybE n=1 Tax=Profundibacter sp. TaxID=3101071 RepID=UPI003D13B513
MSEEAAHIRVRLERRYDEIASTRMQGVPVMNPALRVAALGFEPLGADRLGVLLTPWFMNLVILPGAAGEWATGDKLTRDLPAGRVEFIVTLDEELGPLVMCSLFSPVFEFADQEAALDAGRAALAEVLKAGKDEDVENEAEEKDAGPRNVSRRAFLRGGAEDAA